VIVGNYSTGELFRSGGFLAVVDRFGLPARHPGLIQRADGGGEFVMAAGVRRAASLCGRNALHAPSFALLREEAATECSGGDAHGGAADRR